MNHLIKDIAKLTTVSENSLYHLNERAEDCIAHSVLENILEKNCLTQVDIGMGTLYIKIEEEGIKYKFIPNKRLEEKVAFAVHNKQSPVVAALDTTLKERIESIYKQML